jgi:hypothetical protein
MPVPQELLMFFAGLLGFVPQPSLRNEYMYEITLLFCFALIQV